MGCSEGRLPGNKTLRSLRSPWNWADALGSSLPKDCWELSSETSWAAWKGYSPSCPAAGKLYPGWDGLWAVRPFCSHFCSYEWPLTWTPLSNTSSLVGSLNRTLAIDLHCSVVNSVSRVGRHLFMSPQEQWQRTIMCVCDTCRVLSFLHVASQVLGFYGSAFTGWDHHFLLQTQILSLVSSMNIEILNLILPFLWTILVLTWQLCKVHACCFRY